MGAQILPRRCCACADATRSADLRHCSAGSYRRQIAGTTCATNSRPFYSRTATVRPSTAFANADILHAYGALPDWVIVAGWVQVAGGTAGSRAVEFSSRNAALNIAIDPSITFRSPCGLPPCRSFSARTRSPERRCLAGKTRAGCRLTVELAPGTYR